MTANHRNSASGKATIGRPIVACPLREEEPLLSSCRNLSYAYLRLARTASRGPRASRLCIFNFVVVILSFTVVNLYLSHSHRYF